MTMYFHLTVILQSKNIGKTASQANGRSLTSLVDECIGKLADLVSVGQTGRTCND
jgi:hypothetical protein